MEAIKNYCSKCLQDTNHKELFREKTGSAPEDDYGWSEDFLVVKCMGCGNVSFRKESFNEDSYVETDTGEFDPDISIYPLVLKNRNSLDDVHMLPFHIQIAYEESVKALKSDCRLLAAAGFRAVIEAVCNDKGIKGRDIEKKINNLYSNGFLSKTETVRLHGVRFLGNDSIHEIEVPSEGKLNSALRIIEHLLLNLYIIDKTISDLDTMIERYDDFETLLVRGICKFEKDTEFQLRKAIGKNIRRFTPENLKIFEMKLQNNISSGLYSGLGLGGSTKETIKGQIIDIQNYVILTANPKLGMNRFFQLGINTK
jgi:hypothetical protein